MSAVVTFAQAQERADEWVNGDVPAYQHREVRVREFELGFVVWAEDRPEGPVSDGGRQRLVIARDSGEATLWPGLPVGEVIRRYEEEYGAPAGAPAAAPEPPQRVDLNQTSFLLTPPEWLQEAADKLGIPDHRAERREADAEAAEPSSPSASPSASQAAPPAAPSGDTPVPGPAAAADATPPPPSPSAPSAGGSGASWPAAGGGPAYEPTASDGVPAGATPWAGTDTNSDTDDAAVPLPATVFAPPLSGTDDEEAPPPVVPAEAPTALMSGGSQLPRTQVAPALRPEQGAPDGAGDIADAATSKAVVPPRGTRGGGPSTPPPPGAPGVPGMPPGATPPPSGPGTPGAPAGGYVPTQLVSQLGPPGATPPGSTPPPGPPPAPPGPPSPPGSTPPPGGGVHHAATMLADGSSIGAGVPGAPRPPGPPGAPGAPQPPGPPGAPGAPQPPGPPPGSTPPPGGGVHHAETMFAAPGQVGPPGPPGAPGGSLAGSPGSAPQPPGPPGPPGPPPGGHTPPPPAYGYPQQPTGQPTVGPGYQAVLRFRAPDGSEQQLIRRSAPGTPHPEWQMLHELRAMNVPPQQVIELHTELESCELPGGYCARMIRETWPQVRITSVAPYGTDHASRQQGMQHLLTHQGELHQVADGPARPAPVRAPLPQMPPAPALPPEAIAEELAQAFGPQGILRFDQRAVSRQGVPEVVARTLVWAGLPADFGPFFWAQPGQPVVPTLAELAAQRQVQPASDAGSYLVMGTDFGRAICVQYGTANIVAVPVEAGPGGQPVPPQFVNTGLPEFVRSMALLGRMWRLRYGLNPEQAGRWTVDFQAQLVALDPAALASPESWWSVLLEQMWDGLI
ncbi:SUKH-4 family immunity protein [Streptomyces sp. WA6-1-16]|uniref:SUKH-4 family immunity protein n=1 Tax=Streptomyces sp. WA6-1-16 TaxID=2879427 RepID=UPI001CE30ED7|nr:SUKH-4 family immunity protein [Streptomyces sp. WA6-1-16]UCA48580.1 SUKH-4 family immunity protein [Streptomyces sp. WA6-1-16]